MLYRLKQIDIENTGTITVDLFVTLSEKYGIKLNANDLQSIKERYRKGTSQTTCKIDYMEVLKDIKMKIDIDGKVNWVFNNVKGGEGFQGSPYRIKI